MGPTIAHKVRDALSATLRAVAAHRALRRRVGRDERELLIVTMSAHLDIACLEWCKLFGSRGGAGKSIHWHHVLMNDEPDFKGKLLKYISKSNLEWEQYHKLITDYRDTAVAHSDLTARTDSYPNLDIVVSSSIIYLSVLPMNRNDDISLIETEYLALARRYEAEVDDLLGPIAAPDARR